MSSDDSNQIILVNRHFGECKFCYCYYGYLLIEKRSHKPLKGGVCECKGVKITITDSSNVEKTVCLRGCGQYNNFTDIIDKIKARPNMPHICILDVMCIDN